MGANSSELPVVVTIYRVKKGEEGAFGVMFDQSSYPFAVTLEHTFDSGDPLLPAKTYLCSRTRYEKGGYDTFEIPLVGHARILLHRANTEADLRGCIGVAKEFSEFSSVHGVADSKKGFDEFWAKYGSHAQITLKVVDKY